ncbi:hypothetical protein BTVI_99281 [Pitangus sulphuratus]|nr:hypothetical protein BTVI_99281 [Pitangus sulphuratus]
MKLWKGWAQLKVWRDIGNMELDEKATKGIMEEPGGIPGVTELLKAKCNLCKIKRTPTDKGEAIKDFGFHYVLNASDVFFQDNSGTQESSLYATKAVGSSLPKMMEKLRALMGILSSLKSHGIMEWFGLEGTSKPILFHPGHLSLAQVAPSPVQAGLEHFQGWGIHNFSGQPVPGPPQGTDYGICNQNLPPISLITARSIIQNPGFAAFRILDFLSYYFSTPDKVHGAK